MRISDWSSDVCSSDLVAGIFDVAKKPPVNLPYRPNGFANTLGFYGVEPGPYFYLPLVGPTTLRDMVGNGIDLLVVPTTVGAPFNRTQYAVPTTVIKQLNDRIENDAETERLQRSEELRVGQECVSPSKLRWSP